MALLAKRLLLKLWSILVHGMQILFAAVFTSARMIAGSHLTYVALSADIPLLLKVNSLISDVLVDTENPLSLQNNKHSLH